MKISRTLLCCLLLAAASQCNVISNSREDNSDITTAADENSDVTTTDATTPATDDASDATPATATDTSDANTGDAQSSPTNDVISLNTIDGDALEFWEEDETNKVWLEQDLEEHLRTDLLDGGESSPSSVLSSPVNGEGEAHALGFMTQEEKINSWLLEDFAELAEIDLNEEGAANFTLNSVPSYSSANNSEAIVAEILELRKKGEEYVSLKGYADVILLLGMSGSGKSTVAQFLTTDTLAAVKDKGEFMIRDVGQKISITTSQSHTTFPELVVDRNTSTAYVDCPGFRDTRGVSYDVAATYLTKYAVDMSRRVKLVFSVSHTSVRSSIDRDGFRTLLKHGAKFMKNVDQFKEGIALVVTKVDTTFEDDDDGNPVMVPDVEVKNNIAAFLGEVKTTIQSSTPLTAEEQGSVKLIDIFLEKRGNEYYKFDLFRRPRKAELLIKNKVLLAERTRMRKMINEDLKYISKIASDFGYSLSADSVNSIGDLVKEMNTKISNEVRLIAEHIKNHFQPIEAKSTDTASLHGQFQEWSNFITPLIRAATGSSNLTFITSKLSDVATKYKLSSCRAHLERIAKDNLFLDYLIIVSGKGLQTNHLQWTQPLTGVLEYIEDSKNWYGFLNVLYSKMALHEVQSDTSRYNVADLNDWGKTGKRQGIQVTTNNYKLFVKTIKAFIKQGTDNIDNLKVNQVKLAALNRVLDQTVKQRPQIGTANEKFTARGRFIKLSEVKKELTSILNRGRSIKSVEIFATDTVFIDTDVSLVGKVIAMSIDAPLWEVVGLRNIILNGVAASSQRKANDATTVGGKGDDGGTGYSGGRSGSFSGKSKRIVNAQFLTITANGGKGGAGQDGGNGGKGEDGTDPVWGNVANSENMEQVFRGTPFKMTHKNTDNARWKGSLWSGKRAFTEYYDVHGTEGKVGGPGGNGGKGGFGGSQGTVTVTGQSGVVVVNRRGDSGPGGKGGLGGDGGRNGCVLEMLGVTFLRMSSGKPTAYRYVLHELRRRCATGYGAKGPTGRGG